MQLSLKKFKSFISEFNTVKNFILDGTVFIDYHHNRMNYALPVQQREDACHSINFKGLIFKNFSNAYSFSKTGKISAGAVIKTVKPDKADTPSGKLAAILRSSSATDAHLTSIGPENAALLAKGEKSMRFIPKTALPINNLEYPRMISQAPIEILEGDHTYRVLCECGLHLQNSIYYISRDDDAIYDYLDKGFYMLEVFEKQLSGKQIRRFVLSNQLNIHTAHIFILCQLHSKLIGLIPKGGFVHSNEAEMLRLKLEKKLPQKLKSHYEQVREYLEKDYQSNTSLVLVNKLLTKELDKISLNDITLTHRAVSYNQIKLEASDLLDVLYKKLNFGGEFDIYSIVEIYAHHIQASLEDQQVGEELFNLPVFKINGFDIEVSLSKTGVRRINGKRINKDEIQSAIYRASCHHSQEEYDLFLRRISKMSLLWHDILANGLAVKIHENLTWEDLNNAIAGASAPAIKFFIDSKERCIKIKTDKPEGCRVKLGKLIEKIRTINRKTNGRWTRDGGGHRDYNWARKQLAYALKESTTFVHNVKDENGEIRQETRVGISVGDIKQLIDTADEYKKAAIKKSKDFLATAVKFTEAKEVEFLGKKAYKVDGSLRSYAVIVENAKVYDYQTKQYRCIVNDNHFRGAGYDDIAARLYALKNDSVMQRQITTLAGAAQPAAENAHGNYTPDRDIEDTVLEGLGLD